MAIPAKQRWVVYAIVLALTLTVMRWAGGQDRGDPRTVVAYQAERLERPAREGSAAPGPADAVLAVQLDLLERRAAPAPAGDPFGARSWEPEQPAVKRYVPPPPQAPPLPFTYLGKMVDDGKTTVFLTKEDRNYLVRVGETLDGTYRVESIAEEGLVLTYLPLRQVQTLAFGTAPVPVLASAKPQQQRSRKPAAEDEDDDE